MKHIQVLVAIFLVFCVSGCSGFYVYDKDKSTANSHSTKLNGIPFYRKVGKAKQTTVLARTWLDVRFMLVDVSGEKQSNKRVAKVSIDERSSQQKIAAGVDMAHKAAETGNLSEVVRKFSEAVKPIPMDELVRESSLNVQNSKLVETTLSNTTDVVSVVDYAKPLYLNVKAPLFGKVDGAVELAKDGTLTKATTSVDSTKLADELPLSEYLAGRLGLDVAMAGDSRAGPLKHLLTVDIQRQGYMYVLTKYYDLDHAGFNSPLTYNVADSMLRTSLGVKSGSETKQDNQATFKGSVTLPKR